MVREDDLVAIFHSIHRVMKAEKVLKQAGAEILLIPVPRQLTSDCGLAIRYAPAAAATVEEVLRREGLLPAEIYRREGKAGSPHDHSDVVAVFRGGADATDGIDVTASALGSRFSKGMLVAMNSGARNFLLYSFPTF